MVLSLAHNGWQEEARIPFLGSNLGSVEIPSGGNPELKRTRLASAFQAKYLQLESQSFQSRDNERQTSASNHALPHSEFPSFPQAPRRQTCLITQAASGRHEDTRAPLCVGGDIGVRLCR